jgi:hypothetical protein
MACTMALGQDHFSEGDGDKWLGDDWSQTCRARLRKRPWRLDNRGPFCCPFCLPAMVNLCCCCSDASLLVDVILALYMMGPNGRPCVAEKGTEVLGLPTSRCLKALHAVVEVPDQWSQHAKENQLWRQPSLYALT